MKRAKNQGQLPDYCPINLDYIFAEDNQFLPWLKNRKKKIEAVNSEEENYLTSNLNVRRQTPQRPRQEPIIEVEEGSTSSNASHTDHGNGSESGDDDDDSGSGPQLGSGVGGTSETVVPSTYPYPYVSQSQAPTSTSRDRGKNHIIEGEEEEEEEEEKEEEGDLPIMDSFERRSPWPSCNLNIYTEPPLYPQIPHYPLVPQAPQPGINSYDYLFGYPP